MMLTMALTAEQIEDEASRLEAQARQLRDSRHQKRVALLAELSAAQRRLSDLRASQARVPDVHSDPAVAAAHAAYQDARRAIEEFAPTWARRENTSRPTLAMRP